MLARLGELLGDASAGARGGDLVDEAVRLARSCGDPRTVAEVLDARLHALWDPGAADDRLAAASEIVELAGAAHDEARAARTVLALRRAGGARSGGGGRVGAGRVTPAPAEAAGDGAAGVMVTSRPAMLGDLRGRFDQATG